MHLISAASLPVYVALVLCSSTTIQNNLLHPLNLYVLGHSSNHICLTQRSLPPATATTRLRSKPRTMFRKLSIAALLVLATGAGKYLHYMTYIQLISEEVALTWFNLIYCRGAEEGHRGRLLCSAHAGRQPPKRRPCWCFPPRW